MTWRDMTEDIEKSRAMLPVAKLRYGSNLFAACIAPPVSKKIYSGIARFPCDSMAFLFISAVVVIRISELLTVVVTHRIKRLRLLINRE